MKSVYAAILLLFAALPIFAQDDLLPAGDDGLKKRSWVLMDTQMTVRGERLVEVSDSAIGDRVINYVAFYVKGALVAVDEIPPFKITWDFGPYTQKVRVIAIGVRYIAEEPVTAVVQPVDPVADTVTAKPETSDQTRATAPVEGAISIVAPTAEQYAYGILTIRAETDLPAEQILRVDFSVDGRPAGSAEAPPWEVDHDFGRGFEAQRIRAVALLRDGGQISAEMLTTPLEGSDFFINARLVTLEATVTDYRDRLVGDLRREEFRVFEDGTRQEISHFAVEERPIRVALLIDSSSSMAQRGKMTRAIQAAQGFLQYLKKGQDKAALIVFNNNVAQWSDFTDDFGELGMLIGRIKPEGGTAIVDALDQVAPLFEEETGRKAIVLLTDGVDEHSTTTVDEAIEKVRALGIKVYSIGIMDNDYFTREMQESYAERKPLQGKRPDVDPTDARKSDRTFTRGEKPGSILFEGLADETGGASFYPQKLEELPLMFARVADELRNMYSIGYIPTNKARDGKWREIEIETDRSGTNVRAKRGYYAEK